MCMHHVGIIDLNERCQSFALLWPPFYARRSLKERRNFFVPTASSDAIFVRFRISSCGPKLKIGRTVFEMVIPLWFVTYRMTSPSNPHRSATTNDSRQCPNGTVRNSIGSEDTPKSLIFDMGLAVAPRRNSDADQVIAFARRSIGYAA